MRKMLLPGKHDVIETSKNEYLSLKNCAKEIKYKN